MKGLFRQYCDAKDELVKYELKYQMDDLALAHIMKKCVIPGAVVEDFLVTADETILVLKDRFRVIISEDPVRHEELMRFITNELSVDIYSGCAVDQIVWDDAVPEDVREWILNHIDDLWEQTDAMELDACLYQNDIWEYIEENF